ncbi:hypothetical protein SAMIE_1005250 [Sphingobium amiense]|uniref:Aspartyl protease n=2 Tax=Sphingobium amiense TaxID=135719 RepID=A0A494VX95_9SPHN|nr:retropepsin-like aspartic protease [Sphingobium amiense]BBD97024.1 hypothetical protein SAMIE_1005250 [Sphingobium amiense]
MPRFVTGMLAGAACLLGASPVSARMSYVPVKLRVVSGVRPFAPVRVNGKPFLFMLHSNARFTVMTTHKNAALAGVTNLIFKDHYGISTPGQVSNLGRASATLERLQVGDRTYSKVPALIFEVPQDPPMDGMLGITWLREQHVMLDYGRKRLGLPQSEEDTEAADHKLLAAGYKAHKMIFDSADKSYFVEGTINGVAVRIGVNTVAENVLDVTLARTAGVELGPVADHYGGPDGAQGDVYFPKRDVEIAIDGQEAAPIRPQIFDTYAYDSAPRPATSDAAHTARLGADFMIANRVVIDFGSETIFIGPQR